MRNSLNADFGSATFVSIRLCAFFKTLLNVGCVRINAFACVCIRQDESYLLEHFKQMWRKQIWAYVRFTAFINRRSWHGIRNRS